MTTTEYLRDQAGKAQREARYQRKRAERYETENAKLRELVGELLDNLMPEIRARAWWCTDKDWRKCGDDACGNYTFVILARELGVEVDG